MLEGLEKCEEDLLDVPSYNELLREAIYNARVSWNPSDAIFSPIKTSMAMAVPAVPLLLALQFAAATWFVAGEEGP